MARKQKKTLAKGKKKRWFPITATKMFNEMIIGEIPAYEPEDLVGKTITVNMMFLTNDPKKQNNRISFRIVQVDEGKTVTEVYECKILPSHVRRLVRRGKTRLDDSIVLKSKDGVNARYKPLTLTRGVTSTAVIKGLREKMIGYMNRKVQNNTFEDIVKELIMGRFQGGLKAEMAKIFPMGVCDIRVLKRMDTDPTSTKVEKPVEEPVKKEEKKEEPSESPKAEAA